MWHEVDLAGEFFEELAEIDERICRQVAIAGCSHCDGPLHRADYERKPRGGLIGGAGERFSRRCALCCGREGCRKRSLPPSLRFLGRRVYLEAVVLLASVRALVEPAMRAAQAITGVPVRTLNRWRKWWSGEFPTLHHWIAIRALFAPPPPDESELPKSLLERFADSLGGGSTLEQVLRLASRWLAPMTTQSVADGSRFVHAAEVG